MKNKKAMSSELFKLMVAMTILVLIVMLSIIIYNNFYHSTSNSIDRDVMSKLPKSNSDTTENDVERLNDARLGKLSDNQLKFGYGLTKILFKPSESTSANGELMYFKMPTSTTIENDFSWIVVSLSDSVLTGFYDFKNKQVYKLASSRTKGFDFLEGKDICILPFSNKGLDAAKVLSFATGLKYGNDDSLVTKREAYKIMSKNVVEQVSVSSDRIRYFNDSRTNSIKLETDEKTLLYKLNGITCIFPGKDNGVYYSSNIIKGVGNLKTNLANTLLKLKNIKIQKGDFS